MEKIGGGFRVIIIDTNYGWDCALLQSLPNKMMEVERLQRKLRCKTL